MIIGYARVSSIDQTPALQLDALRAAGCEQVFHEQRSGGAADRAELVSCLRMLRPGDTLVVWKLDRLARSMKDLVEILQGLEARQVAFRSLTEAIDTTSAGGRLVFHIFGALAEFERALIRERTRAGLAAARARGRKGGRPRKLTREQARMATAMLQDPQITKTAVAKHFSVARGTLDAALRDVA